MNSSARWCTWRGIRRAKVTSSNENFPSVSPVVALTAKAGGSGTLPGRTWPASSRKNRSLARHAHRVDRSVRHEPWPRDRAPQFHTLVPIYARHIIWKS